jgi:NADH-quinone oxidoreductase subunit F
VSASNAIPNAAALEAWRAELVEARAAVTQRVRVCIGTGCAAKGARKLYELFQAAAGGPAGAPPGRPIAIEAACVGCHGLCERGPIVVIDPGNILYQRVEEADVEEIFRETVLGGRVIERLLYDDPGSGRRIQAAEDIPFYKAQRRIVLQQNGHIDPTSIEDYIAAGGYAALAKALTMEPDRIIREVEISGLRGRGGGGFPTARKWRSAREAPGEPRYLICNGDEGDPGAFMDRSVMEGNPHLVLEGMIIAAFAIGSHEGYIYVRNEYPLAVEHLRRAIDGCRECGLLGDDILASGFAFDVGISRGGGAFVCGESTALMASLEGRVGRPRAKYVHSVERGLNEKPTCLNNVETYATVPTIITNGGAWLASIGTAGSKGTKIFSLVGKINNTGLVEVPMGIRLREIVEVIGGGIPGGKAFKAVQTGGPSGGCIPAAHLDVPVDFDELTTLGSMMGSGGMIVMDEDTCMVDMARYFLHFLKGESCGKCVACREGVRRMLEIVERVCAGHGRVEDLDTLEELGEYLVDTALCALGATAANPVLTTLRYFRGEYESHIREHYCPSGVCKSLFQYVIDAGTCNGCQACVKRCPVDAISGEKKAAHVISLDACIKCGACYETCRHGAIGKARMKEVVA